MTVYYACAVLVSLFFLLISAFFLKKGRLSFSAAASFVLLLTAVIFCGIAWDSGSVMLSVVFFSVPLFSVILWLMLTVSDLSTRVRRLTQYTAIIEKKLRDEIKKNSEI